MSDLEERVERLEEEVGVEPMPTFDGWKMAEKVDEVNGLTVWRDGSGDGWIQYPNGDADCFMGTGSAVELIDAIKEANR